MSRITAFVIGVVVGTILAMIVTKEQIKVEAADAYLEGYKAGLEANPHVFPRQQNSSETRASTCSMAR